MNLRRDLLRQALAVLRLILDMIFRGGPAEVMGVDEVTLRARRKVEPEMADRGVGITGTIVFR